MKKEPEYLSVIMTKEEFSPPEKVVLYEKSEHDKIEPIFATYLRPKFKIDWKGKKTAVKIIKLNELNVLNMNNDRKDSLLISNNKDDENNKLRLRVLEVIPKRLCITVMRTDTPLAFIKWFFLNKYKSTSKKIECYYFYKIVFNSKFLRKLHKIK